MKALFSLITGVEQLCSIIHLPLDIDKFESFNPLKSAHSKNIGTYI